jgi:acyl-CoA synthetase (NDP forming)
MSIIEKSGIAWALTPARTAFAAGALARFARKRADYLAAKGRETRVIAPQALHLRPGAGALSEHESKLCLTAYGIIGVAERLLSLAEVEALAASPLKFPLAVKIDSPDIAHKTEIDAVRLNIGSLAQLKAAAREIWSTAATARPDARLNGVLIAEMAQGTEVIAGVVNDAYFGPVVMFGLGGIFTEVLQDVTYRFAPFDSDTARAMIGEIASARVLQGYRGRPALAVDALADMLARLSCLAADHADRISEIDLNPVLVDTQRVLVADALLVLRGATAEPR